MPDIKVLVLETGEYIVGELLEKYTESQVEYVKMKNPATIVLSDNRVALMPYAGFFDTDEVAFRQDKLRHPAMNPEGQLKYAYEKQYGYSLIERPHSASESGLILS